MRSSPSVAITVQALDSLSMVVSIRYLLVVVSAEIPARWPSTRLSEVIELTGRAGTTPRPAPLAPDGAQRCPAWPPDAPYVAGWTAKTGRWYVDARAWASGPLVLTSGRDQREFSLR